MKSICPCLAFAYEALDAVNYYLSIFKNSKLSQVTHYGEDEPLWAGIVKSVCFSLNGQDFMAINVGENFDKLNHGFSLMIKCENQSEIDYLWEKLSSRGGSVEERGWLRDKYGVSWQIVPAVLDELLNDNDIDRSHRVSTELYKMKKLNVEHLRNA
jgi:predicted 3-demethylubiquinone-9 3-methyltransferase (glyoxalase superfamily)